MRDSHPVHLRRQLRVGGLVHEWIAALRCFSVSFCQEGKRDSIGHERVALGSMDVLAQFGQAPELFGKCSRICGQFHPVWT